MTIADYDGVYRLWQNTPGMELNNLDDSRGGILRYLTRNPTTCFVAETSGEIIGVILCGHDGRRGFIHHTAVKALERKQGVGTALVDAALNALREQGIAKAALAVFATNEMGNAFWEKCGFTVREDLHDRNKTPDRHLVRMDTAEGLLPHEA
jgi:ribosomal protein S18 acetylase RimI-like enzyme